MHTLKYLHCVKTQREGVVKKGIEGTEVKGRERGRGRFTEVVGADRMGGPRGGEGVGFYRELSSELLL